jgi:hypothetical protein
VGENNEKNAMYSEKSPLGTDKHKVNPLTPELNPSAQRCLTRIFTGDFAS